MVVLRRARQPVFLVLSVYTVKNGLATSQYRLRALNDTVRAEKELADGLEHCAMRESPSEG